MKVITISVDKRKKEASEIQEILTQYGAEIHSRIGYHNIEKDNKGLIIVIYTGEHVEEFCKALKEKQNVKIDCIEI